MRLSFLIVVLFATLGLLGCAGRDAEVGPRRPSLGVEETVRRAVAEILSIDPRTIDMARPLAELGAEDLDVLEIVMTIEEDLGVMFPDDLLEWIEGKRPANGPVRLTPDDLVRIARDARPGPKMAAR
jgi:acyl carrier protein